ncbi:MAG: acyl-CoA dehydrogenase [Actinomycetia bacterium]|nr:acyl-CoA dehydrogenase [Actinomycetes bacterium]
MSADVPGLDAARVQQYFERHVAGCDGPIEIRLLLGGRSNLTYAVTDGERSWVLRRPPMGLVAPSANDVGREYRYLAALRDTDVPVPATVALCTDLEVTGAPFSVVTMVDGDVVRTTEDGARLGPAAADHGRHLVTTLATLHQVDPEAVGLAAGGAPGYSSRQVARWRDQWEIVRTQELPDLDRLHAALASDVPAASRAAVVHGDYRIDNVLFRPDGSGEVAAVIDWEMATVGDPLADLGLLLAYWNPACAPLLADLHPISANAAFPTPDELVATYERAADVEVARLPFFVALGHFKLAVIAEGIHHRFLDGDTVGDGFDRAGAAVAPLVAAGLGVLAGA